MCRERQGHEGNCISSRVIGHHEVPCLNPPKSKVSEAASATDFYVPVTSLERRAPLFSILHLKGCGIQELQTAFIIQRVSMFCQNYITDDSLMVQYMGCYRHELFSELWTAKLHDLEFYCDGIIFVLQK